MLELLLANREFLRPFEPTRPDSFYTLDGVGEELNAATVVRSVGVAYVFGITCGNRLVGRLELSSISRHPFLNAHLGYWVEEASNGRGYATEAVRLTAAFALGTAGLHRLQAAVMPRNTPSRRVLEKNGFRLEGLAERYLEIAGSWEDHLIFALTREEWPAHSS